MTASPSAVMVLCTCPPGSAEPLARRLVEERAAACVNILPAVQSIYRWQDRVESDGESLLIIKTTRQRWQRLARLVEQEHPYDVPELISVPLENGSQPYLNWVGESVRD